MKKIYAIFFIGFLILSIIGASAENVQHQDEKTLSGDELDQYSTECEGVMPVGGLKDVRSQVNVMLGQSFIPQKEYLTRIKLFIGRNATTTNPITLAIRENISKENIAESSVESDDFQILNGFDDLDNLTWVEFSFDYVDLTINETYYFVIYTDNISDNFYYVGGADGNPYSNGSAYFTFNDGKDWEVETDADGCFKSFGVDTIPDLEVTIEGGLNINLTIKNNGEGDAFNVDYKLSVTGGLLGLINNSAEDTINIIESGESFTEELSIFGLGLINVNATVNGDSINKNGLVLLFFVILFP